MSHLHAAVWFLVVLLQHSLCVSNNFVFYAFLQSNIMYLRPLFSDHSCLTGCKPKFRAITLGPQPVST